MLKRGFDIAASAAGILLLSPLLAAIAVAIRLDSPGPIFFRQRRMGLGFQPFLIWKFRTMTAGADQRGSLTLRHDTRVTRVGAGLRRLKLDELPQLFNVIRGEMSLVGPRPELPRYVERFRAEYESVLRVRPGITDLASLRFRSESELLASSADAERIYCEEILPVKLRLAREYLQRASFGYDLQLILQTVWAALAPARPQAVQPPT
jgi:lipopolysaccharide/colanic/teichoic acid biosynthesis glycosyltransferase